MGAACVTTIPRDNDEIGRADMDSRGKSKKEELLPASSISLLFSVMSQDIGYDSSALQSYCEKLQSFWIYRVIDILNIDNETWKKIEIPSVLEHVISDYLNELKNTATFTNYSQLSHTDIYITFINKDIRTLFKQLLSSVNNLPSATKYIQYLQDIFAEKYVFNTDILKKYITKQEWNELNVPINLKRIICRKINLNFEGEDSVVNSNIIHGEDELSDEVVTAMPGIQVVDDDSVCYEDEKEEKTITTNNMNAFDEKINKNINARFTMMDIAKYYSKYLLVDDINKMYNHLKYFVLYGYNTLYHLSFICDDLFDKLLLITSTPKSFQFELFELVQLVREKYNDSMNNISKILPFSANVYWEKLTVSAFKILEKDINLNLEKECNVLMNKFYSNIWDWQFIDYHILMKELNAYHKYQIVRIRMQHIIKLCQYQYGQENIPRLPPIWNCKYNQNLIVDKILSEAVQFENDYNEFQFDGLDWNENTKQKSNILRTYLEHNFVRKLQFLGIQHRKNDKLWNELMRKNNISPHLRFKINFYALRGVPNCNDIWINNYISSHFKKILPQFNQCMDINIISGEHKEMYNDIENKVICIENMLHFINVFNKKVRMKTVNNSNQQIIEMNEMILSTIKEINEMGLNKQIYQIIQFCGSRKLLKLKKNKFKLLVDNNNIDITQFDQEKCNQLIEIYNILSEMKNKIYSIPIEDILNLSQTVCGSVQWLQTELNNYKTNQ